MKGIPKTKEARKNRVLALQDEIQRIRSFDQKDNRESIVPWLIENKIVLEYRMGNNVYPILDKDQRLDLYKLMYDGGVVKNNLACPLAKGVTIVYNDDTFYICCSLFGTYEQIAIRVCHALLDLGLKVTMKPHIDREQRKIDELNAQLDHVKSAWHYMKNVYSGTGERLQT